MKLQPSQFIICDPGERIPKRKRKGFTMPLFLAYVGSACPWFVARIIMFQGSKIRFLVERGRWMPEKDEPSADLWLWAAVYAAEYLGFPHDYSRPEVVWYDSGGIVQQRWLIGHASNRTYVLHLGYASLVAHVPDDPEMPLDITWWNGAEPPIVAGARDAITVRNAESAIMKFFASTL